MDLFNTRIRGHLLVGFAVPASCRNAIRRAADGWNWPKVCRRLTKSLAIKLEGGQVLIGILSVIVAWFVVNETTQLIVTEFGIGSREQNEFVPCKIYSRRWR